MRFLVLVLALSCLLFHCKSQQNIPSEIERSITAQVLLDSTDRVEEIVLDTLAVQDLKSFLDSYYHFKYASKAACIAIFFSSPEEAKLFIDVHFVPRHEQLIENFERYQSSRNKLGFSGLVPRTEASFDSAFCDYISDQSDSTFRTLLDRSTRVRRKM